MVGGAARTAKTAGTVADRARAVANCLLFHSVGLQLSLCPASTLTLTLTLTP